MFVGGSSEIPIVDSPHHDHSKDDITHSTPRNKQAQKSQSSEFRKGFQEDSPPKNSFSCFPTGWLCCVVDNRVKICHSERPDGARLMKQKRRLFFTFSIHKKRHHNPPAAVLPSTAVSFLDTNYCLFPLQPRRQHEFHNHHRRKIVTARSSWTTSRYSFGTATKVFDHLQPRNTDQCNGSGRWPPERSCLLSLHVLEQRNGTLSGRRRTAESKTAETALAQQEPTTAGRERLDREGRLSSGERNNHGGRRGS